VISTVQESDITIDGALLLDIARRRARVWAISGTILFAAILVIQLFFLPQAFTSTVSVTIQQPPSTPLGGLALFTGMANSSKYIGILKSRRIADKVVKTLHLAQLYHTSPSRISHQLQTAVRVKDDTGDGLVYVDVAVPGPPLLGQDPLGLRPRLPGISARVGNAYVEALRQYYIQSDNDRDSVLLRSADQQLHEARADFDAKAEAVRSFVHGLRDKHPLVLPAIGSNSPGVDATALLGELPTLFAAMADNEVEIKMREAARKSEEDLVAGQMQDLSKLPDEDPLLQRRRVELNDAKLILRNMEISLNKDNPQVVLQHQRVNNLEQALRHQEAGVRSHLTTSLVQEQSFLQGLYAKRDLLQHQLEDAKERLRQRTDLTAEFSRLQTEVTLSFGMLQAAVAKAAELRMNTASAQSRVVIVDDAVAPDKGAPSLLRMLLICLAVVLVVLCVWLVVDYMRQSRRISSGPLGPSGTSGHADASDSKLPNTNHA
jgi:uncharacterized protein involved in exopolysaccharide biosynthesis